MSDVDPLRDRFAATRTSGETPDWSRVQQRASRIASRERRRKALVLLSVAAGAVALLSPTPGLGQQLLDVIANRPARPALQRYLERIPTRRELGQLDVARAQELIDAPSARGTITLFAAPSANDGDCLGLYASWLDDPGVSCGYRAAAGPVAASLVGRVDPHVLALVGTAPVAAERVRLETPQGSTTSAVVRGYFLLVMDPSVFPSTPAVTISALAADGQAISSGHVDLAAFYDARCSPDTPGHVVRSVITADGGEVGLHAAQTVKQRCYWLGDGGDGLGGIFSEPLVAATYDPANEPPIIPREASFPSGATVLWGRAAVAANEAVVHFEDGRTATVPTPDGYLLIGLTSEQRTEGHRPVGIDLVDLSGARVGQVRVDPAHPGRLDWP